MMDHTNNGGPAFPSPAEHFSDGTLSGHATYGMSLRDYFIAHAPAEPQPWFKPAMPEARPESPRARDVLNEDDLRDWFSDRLDSEPEACSPALREFSERLSAAAGGARAWDQEHEKQRYIQWPAAWADEQLRAREAA
ncbi:hypothetical protein [Ralstonia phage RPZH6]|nr:hypothetical protein [Ralstonia phage RPZH6]